MLPVVAWKYWLPDPRVVISSAVEDRQRRFVYNWLRVREAWLYILTHYSMRDEVIGPLKPPQWREYLNNSPESQSRLSKPTKRAEQNREVVAIFKKVFDGEIPGAEVPPMWFGVNANDLVGPQWIRLCQEVTWELSEIGFRFELSELDRQLVPECDELVEQRARQDLINQIFPHDRGIIMKRLPDTTNGLASSSPKDRAAHLENLRLLVSRWPNVPASVKQSVPFTSITSPSVFEQREIEITAFYCQTFFDLAGRAPIIPRSPEFLAV